MGSESVPKEVELTYSVFGAKVTLRATGVTGQVAGPSKVTIGGPDGKPFAPANSNATAPEIKVEYKPMTDAELKAWLAAETRNIGNIAPDGTKYAGISRTTGTAMFAMPEDWGGKMSWKKAMKFPQTVVAFGYKGSKQVTEELVKNAVSKDDGGWRMPTLFELNELCCNRHEIGGFSPCLYWSSERDACSQSFENNKVDYLSSKYFQRCRVRLVRTLPRDWSRPREWSR